jgi:hypothetical protein
MARKLWNGLAGFAVHGTGCNVRLSGVTITNGARNALKPLRQFFGGHDTLDENSQNSGLLWPDEPADTDLSIPDDNEVALPPDGKFAGSYQGYIVIPQLFLDAVVEATEAEPAAFGSYAAMGATGSFELRHSDAVTSSALSTWPGVIDFYYGREFHLGPIVEAIGIPVVPLKKDFLHAYERVITELGQL